MTVGALLVIGTGFYAANMMKSANEAKEIGLAAIAQIWLVYLHFPPSYDCE